MARVNGRGGGSPRQPNAHNSDAPPRRENSTERSQRLSLGRPQGKPDNRSGQPPRSVVFNKDRLDKAAAETRDKGRLTGATVNSIDADPNGDNCERSQSDDDQEQEDFDGQYEAIDPAPGNDY